MKGIDIHAHLCFPDTYENVDKLVETIKKEMTAVISSSARYDESIRVLELAKKYPGLIFPTLGYHPVEGDDSEGVMRLIKENKDLVVAVGEVGLDYHWEQLTAKREKQKEVFHEFLRLSKQLKKPVVIHSWDAERDCFETARAYGIPLIFHCYSGGVDLAKEILDEGYHISISTNICFSKKLKKVAKIVPMKQMLLETDAPFLDPDRIRKKNVPWNIRLSADKIAELKGVTKEYVLDQTSKNAVKVFNLKLRRQ